MTTKARRPKAILFDVGGLLILPNGKQISEQIAPVIGASIDPVIARDAFAYAGREARRAEDPQRFWNSEEMGVAWARHAKVAPELAQDAWKTILASDGEGTPLWSELNPDARPTLTELRRRGFRRAAVSNADGRLDQELRGFGLRDLFDVVIDSQLAGVAKPHSAIFNLALRDLGGVARGDAWFVGDDPYFDVAGALNAGLDHAILFDRLGLYDDADAKHRVTALTDLLEIEALAYDSAVGPSSDARVG